MICQYCNSQIPDGLKVCFQCGKALAEPPVQIIYDPPPVFAADQTAHGEPPHKEKNYSKKSMVLGIISLITFVIGIGIIPGVIGLVFGIIALKENHPYRSKAIVGVVTSGATVFFIVSIFIYVIVTGGIPS